MGVKLKVVHAGAIVTDKGIIHMSTEYENVKSWAFQGNDRHELLRIEMEKGQIILYNYQHVLRVEIDPFGTVRL